MQYVNIFAIAIVPVGFKILFAAEEIETPTRSRASAMFFAHRGFAAFAKRAAFSMTLATAGGWDT